MCLQKGKYFAKKSFLKVVLHSKEHPRPNHKCQILGWLCGHSEADCRSCWEIYSPHISKLRDEAMPIWELLIIDD